MFYITFLVSIFLLVFIYSSVLLSLHFFTNSNSSVQCTFGKQSNSEFGVEIVEIYKDRHIIH